MHAFEIYHEFLADKRLLGLTPKTLQHYHDTAFRFIEWCRNEGCDTDDLAALPRFAKSWLNSCIERGLRPYTIHTYGRGVRTFLNWMVREGYLEGPLRFICPRRPRSHIVPLETKHLRKIMRLYEQDHSLRGLRNYCILRLFCETGLRKSEMASICLSDVDMTSGSIRVIGKGDKHRFCYFTERTQQALRLYIDLRKQSGYTHEYLWVSVANAYKNRPFRADGIRELLREVKRRIRYTGKLSPHILRHTFAIMYLENGGDAFSLQQALGHAHVSTTQNYVHYSRTRLKRVIQRYQPSV